MDFSNKIYELKGAALDRRLTERRSGKAIFAKKLGDYTTEALRVWRKGRNWPQQLEGKMEELLLLPSGFFQRIGAGVSYEEALGTGGVPGRSTLPLTGNAAQEDQPEYERTHPPNEAEEIGAELRTEVEQLIAEGNVETLEHLRNQARMLKRLAQLQKRGVAS